MPRYGWTMTEGKIVQWLKKEGEEVRSGDPLLVIESEKTQIEVEAEASGVLRKILAPEGSIRTCDSANRDNWHARRRASPG